MAAKKKKVMVFGTFDLFHKGHESFLRQAKAHGGLLVAVVARDITVANVKGSKPWGSEKERVAALERSGIADKVMFGSLGDKYALIRKEKPDVICLGYDQDSFTRGLRSALKSMGIKAEIRRMEPHMRSKYKTSVIKRKIRAKHSMARL